MTVANPTLANRNRRSAMIFGALALAMLGLGYASVPLYRLFCQVTGYGGTTQRADLEEAKTVQISDKTMTIRFDSNVNSALPWHFRPENVTDKVSVGARDMTIFIAKNESDRPVTGTATFNVTPELAGKYFNKIQCFCFTEQTLKPGETVRMPVLYYVDPAILTDPDTRDIQEITLSYTFYRSLDGKAVDQPATGG